MIEDHIITDLTPYLISAGPANGLTLAVVGLVMGIVFLVVSARELRFSLVLVALGIGFGLPAIGVALIPFNVFHGVGGPRSKSGGYPKVADLTLVQRRILVAFYAPGNRRAAAATVLVMSLVWLLIWGASFLFLQGPLVVRRFRANELILGGFISSVSCAGWAALFGLTRQVRREWDRIVTGGLAWPEGVEFPGPLPEAVRSFFTGRLPNFLGAEITGSAL